MLLAALALTVGLQSSPPEEPLATSVCEILADPSAFNGRRVAVEGYFHTDWWHRSLLVDRACGYGISVGAQRGTEARREFAPVLALRDQRLEPDAVWMSVVATFSFDPDVPITQDRLLLVDDVVELEIDPAFAPDPEILARLTAAAASE